MYLTKCQQQSYLFHSLPFHVPTEQSKGLNFLFNDLNVNFLNFNKNKRYFFIFNSF